VTYRDEREALHNQVAALEEDLAEARREAAAHDEGAMRDKAAALEAQMVTMRAELARMETELADLRGPSPPKPTVSVMPRIVLVGATLAAFGVGAVVSMRAATPPPRPIITPIQPQPPPDPLPDLMDKMRQNAKEPAPSATIVPPEPPRTTEARWIARVKRADGMPLAAGSTCTIDATIAAHGVNAVVDELVVTCGGKKLYAKSDPLNGMAMMNNDARERLGPSDEKSRFTLQYNDKGTRGESRNQIDLDSNKGIGLIFSENLPPFRLELTIPVESEPAVPLSGKGQRLSRTGTVDGVSGAAAPVKKGEKCVVRALPTGQQQSCVAEVRCGNKTLVATSVPVECSYRGSQIDSVTGSGSPSLSVADDGAKLSVVGDRGYSVDIAYDKD
jgi:hypothetical protein